MANPEFGPEQRTGTHAVAGPWAADVGSGEADDNDRQLRRLAAFLEDAAGFQLALVTCDDRELRERQLERLAERLEGTDVWLTRLDFTETPQERQLLERLRAHLDAVTVPEGKRPAVMVVGIEATLDYSRLGRQSGQGLAMLENANAQRDAFARQCPVAVAFWLNPTATSLFALHAPDLWHWRNGTFRFTGADVSRLEFEERLVGMPLVESDSLSRRAKLERIASLRDLVAELDASSSGATRRGRQRRAALLSELGLAHLAMGEARSAIAILEEALLIAREIGDRRQEGAALGNLGWACADLGDARKAIEYCEQALVIVREIGDRRGEGNALGNLGSAYADLGDARKAIAFYEQCLHLHREIGDRRGEGADLGNLGLAYADLGDARKAIEYYEQQLVVVRQIGDRRGEGAALGNLGSAYAALGDVRKAMECYEQYLAIAREIGDRRGEGNALGNLGNCYARLGDARKAIGYYEQALTIDREIGERRGEGAALGNLGNAYVALGDARKAIEYYEQHLGIALEIGDRRGECAALGNMGDEWRKLGETEKARDCLEQGLRLALLAGDPLRTVQVAWLLRPVYADTGDAATAVGLEAFAFARFQAMGYPQAKTAGANLARYRQEMGEAKFLEALARSEQTVADLFRKLAGDQAAAMAAGILQAFADQNRPPDAAE